MANPVRLFRLWCSVILILGLQLTPVAVAVAARDVNNYEYDDKEYEYEYDDNEEDDYDNDNDDPVKATNINNNNNNNNNNNDSTCDHGICRDDQDIDAYIHSNHKPYSGGSASSRYQHRACEDLRDDCEQWADQGKCFTDSKYMHPHCPRTCKTCHNRTIRHVPTHEAFSAPLKSQYQYSEIHRRNIQIPIVSIAGTDLGVPQIISVEEPLQQQQQQQQQAAVTLKQQAVLERIAQAREYVEHTVMIEDRYESVRTLCKHQNEACAVWAVAGECEDNPVYMRAVCAPVCFSCEELHVAAKCPLDPDAVNAWEEGDLASMFERILTNVDLLEQYNYTPTVLSRPDYVNQDTEETAGYQIGPWVLILDNFLSVEETERMIAAGHEIGYARSTDVGEVQADGTFEDVVSTSRTSMNAWCNEPVCQDDPLVQNVIQRIQAMTQIPLLNSESLQLLRYTEGQFYKVHHDYIGAEQGSAQGVRILTVFLYLSDVEEGGGTNFPYLNNLTVEPVRGRALLWPSVLDDDPEAYDPRTFHQALPVLAGLKYGANAWFHQRDVVTPTNMGC